MATSDKWIKKWNNVDGKWEIELTINPKYAHKKNVASSKKRGTTSADSTERVSRKKRKSVSTHQKRDKKRGIYLLTQENYRRAVESKEWRDVCQAVIARDHNACRICGGTANLRVHHKYYIKGRAIWNYPIDALQTMCESCHTQWHDTHRVEVYDSLPLVGTGYRRLLLETCPRCGGKGFISGYNHVESGTCFLCFGSGYYKLFDIPKEIEE